MIFVHHSRFVGTGVGSGFNSGFFLFGLGTVADTSFAGFAVFAGHTEAGIVGTLAVLTLAVEFTGLVASVETSIFLTGAIDTLLTGVAGHILAGVIFALAIFADLAIGTGRAGFDAGAIAGATVLIVSTVAIATGVVCAFAIGAEFAGVLASAVVASRRSTFARDTDAGGRTVFVKLTIAITGALSVSTGLTRGAGHAGTGGIDTATVFADALAFAGGFFAGIFDTLATFADFASGAFFVFAGVGSTFAIDTDFAILAEDTGTGTNTLTIAAEFTVGAGFAVTGVFFALAIHTKFAALAVFAGVALRNDTLVLDTELVAGAVTVVVTGRGSHTLTELANLLAVGAFDTEALVIFTLVFVGVTDSAVLTDVAGVAAFAFAGTFYADFTGFAGDAIAGVFDTGTIDTHLT